MKKLLSILICVVLGVGNLWSATVTINTTCSPTNGGTVVVKTKTATEYKNFKGWQWPSAWSSTNVGTPQYNGGLISHSVGIKYQLTATTKAGYYFEKWTGVPVGKVGELGDCTEETIKEVTGKSYEGTTKYVSSDIIYNIEAIFKEQTVYKDYANAVAMLVDNNGKLFPYGTPGDYTVKVGDEQAGKTCTYNASKSLKTFDNDQGGTWSYTYTAACSDGYEFVGWFEADDNGNLPTTNGVIGTSSNTGLEYTKSYPTTTLYSDRANAPEAKTMYAVFRPKLHLYSYVAKDDAFNDTPMDPDGVTVNSNTTIFNYTDNVTDGVAERYYKIVETFDGDVAVSAASGDFSGTIETIQGMTVLHVRATNPAEELNGIITLSVGGTNRVVLSITATQIPIFVTLNPAENLAGKYSYTQNTTGTQEFLVTTAPVQKQMLTATDYSFAFKPTPNEATKYQFDRWIIREADGDIIEDVTPNLSYRFSGGEAITPVFIRKDAATYIVKSEPKITYLDLQEALDRAAALKTATGTDQIVVVTSTTGILLQGDYTIRNGVTLLIPGEDSYTPMIGAVTPDDFEDRDRFVTYCTLSVDDNTTITVENGNISIYAKMYNIQGYNGRPTIHGHMKLGKNCQIYVKKGGLYSFGYITGDNTSHITMESGTTTYEAFQFTDWRGGSEVMNQMGNQERVFPVGQYYVQTIEVPITFKYGAEEWLATAVNMGKKDIPLIGTVTIGVLEANVKFISTYDTDLCLFGMTEGATLTKSYDPSTDRLKFEFNGNGEDNSKVKIGHLQLSMKPHGVAASVIAKIDVDSKDYVMPIQNNIDIEVSNTTIDVTSDVALMPGSVLRVYDNAVININSGVEAYVYDQDARRYADNSGYWGTYNNHLKALSKRPGGMQCGRGEGSLVDARMVINGDMNIRGALYTVKGQLASSENNVSGADITSDGSGKINIYNIGTRSNTYQWKQGNKAQSIPLTSPNNLLLHNDVSKGATAEYTAVKNDENQDLKTKPLSYTYYQSDGTWRLPIAGITGVKLYNNENQEIDKFLVTLPTIQYVDGYLLATLELISTVKDDLSDFVVDFTNAGQVAQNGKITMVDGKLRVPIRYTTQNKHGKYNDWTISITNSQTAGFECAITVPVMAEENYTPAFTIPSTLNIYAKVQTPTAGALPIAHEVDNVVTLIPAALNTTGKTKWTATWTGAKDYFQFEFGPAGQELSGAKIIFTPDNITARTCTLALKATYTDDNDYSIHSVERKVIIKGQGLMIDNTLDFNNVGTITVNTNSFDLLKGINSEGAISYEILDGAVTGANAIVTIEPKDASDVNGNYTVTPENVGQVTIKVTQKATQTHNAKSIEKTIVVVADPEPLEGNSCVENADDFQTLTADLGNVEYKNSQIQFLGGDEISYWIAQFSSMPGTMTFTPHGDGYWAIQESKDGINWSEIIWWTQLPSGKPATVVLQPTSRRVKISYIKVTQTGYITGLCINPFAIHAETTKIYAPVVGGVVQPTSVVFTHSSPSVTFACEGLTVSPTTGSSVNLGGVLNTYYQTTVTISGGTAVTEQNDAYTLIATQGTETAEVKIGTYNFPKPLPMESSVWVSDDDKANENGYDESEIYYHYMTSSEYVKWDAERSNVVFLNPGSDEDYNRQVAFGYYGLPDEVRFQSLSTDWMIEESEDGETWTNATQTGEVQVITLGDGYQITQPINHTSKYVRITYIGEQLTEVLLSNLEIEGFPSAVPDQAEVEVSKGDDSEERPFATFNIHVMNLASMKLNLDNIIDFKLYYYDVKGNWPELTNDTELTDVQYDFLQMNEEGDITIKVEWKGRNLVNEGHITILNGQNQEELNRVRIVGKKNDITLTDANTGIWTGVPDGEADGRPTAAKYTINGSKFEPYTYHEVNVQNAFDEEGNALFNYMVIYGETTTTDGNTTIKEPTRTAGSNAKTPYYIYQRNANGTSYTFIQAVENANVGTKANLSEISHYNEFIVDGVSYYAIKPTRGQPLSFYMTGFCPYATTGSTKDDEGVWYFKGEVGDKLDIYLEDCHIYSRNKSFTGQTTAKNDEASPDFTGDIVRGSGAVLVFENANPQQDNQESFEVAIHTKGHNVLKSNYGAYYTFIGTLQATQISSPVQVRLGDFSHFATARTTLDFDDFWPLSDGGKEHTNGFLSLQKLANNAPSIDLGNTNTVVNFRGGQVQLQNAQVVSPNYKTTLAISHRSGLMGNVNIQMAYGIGTDDVGGTVNFYDGTTTVLPMSVDEAYRGFYLMDTDANGNELTTTSCLRLPEHTYVYGGSHCMMRACSHVTSKGGAPKDGPEGVLLGRYVYNNTNNNQGYTYRCAVDELPADPRTDGYREGYELIFEGNRYVVDLENNTWTKIGPATVTDPCYIVTPTNFPGNLTYQGALLSKYYENYPDDKYGLNSITPDKNGDLSFWIPEGVVPGIEPEQDKQISAWKACMTEIEAGAFGVTGRIGGVTSVEFDEEVTNLLYCQLDANIYNVVNYNTAVEENGEEKRTYHYSAPVVDPTGMLPEEERYMRIAPIYVGDSAQHSIVSVDDYHVTNQIYYVTTAQADKWMNFTMPFDVARIWVVEAYSEAEIEAFFNKSNKTADEKREGESDMEATLRFQARHNADFAAFFGVAMAIGDNSKSFEDIYAGYIDWAKNKADKDNNLYTSGTYDLRGKYPLTHYNGSNFTTSHFYLYQNNGDWLINDEGEYTTQWKVVPAVPEGKAIMKKGETYSMLFPYCLGCDVQLDENNQLVVDEDGLPVIVERDYWDYWSGKFLIFESTVASVKEPHIVRGGNFINKTKNENKEWIFDVSADPTKAVLTGNSTFTMMHTDIYEEDILENIYMYYDYPYNEHFAQVSRDLISGEYPIFTPTTTFMINGAQTKPKLITRDGRVVYGKGNSDGTTTGSNIPTVGGGNELFITSTATGINVAVAQPQQVRVMSATGAIIYSGMVQTAVDVLLPTTGVYVVAGENEVHKILH